MSTAIEWTNETWNPIRGCSRVSAGCGGSDGGGCYAERQAHRFSGPGGPYEGLTRMTEKGPRWTGKIRLVPELLDEPLRWRKPRRVFVASMSDLFHEDVPYEFIARVFKTMACAERHTFQVLTKRPERMMEFMRRWDDGAMDTVALFGEPYPLPNVSLGVSVENQETADERIPLLLQTPAAVRFVSAEPLLEAVTLRNEWLRPSGYMGNSCGVSWLIVGGESGPGARPMDLTWARSIVEQCRAAGVPVFVKQMGRWLTGDSDGFCVDRWLLDGGTYWKAPLIGPLARQRPQNAIAFGVCDLKGGRMGEWPEDLRVRQFPAPLGRAEGRSKP